MIAVDTPAGGTPATRRLAVTPAIELLVLLVAAAIGIGSYFVLTSDKLMGRLVPPPLIALLLVANILPGVIILMLIGRRIARRRAARSPIGGRGQLHVRLVAIFSIMATVPVLLVAISASLLFQYGGEFLSSPRARSMLTNATLIARENYQQEIKRVRGETVAMSGDVADYLRGAPIDQQFSKYFFIQTFRRNLSEAMIFREGDADPLAVLNPYGRPLRNLIDRRLTDMAERSGAPVMVRAPDRIGVLVPLDYGRHTYLYAARIFDDQLTAQMQRGEQVLVDYQALQQRARALQLRFNAALLATSILIVGLAVWIALAVADRLVRPVGELVAAARRVEGGDLTARVPDPRSPDEVGTLAKAFNQMTGRLERQNSDLTSANTTLENRRALIEAVMAGVSAGVVATTADGTIRIANASAARLLGGSDTKLPGQQLSDVAPELAALLTEQTREAVVEVGQGERTLAVRIARTEAGPILTFDDITQQVLDQRRAAWADVARRIAHEIKNPLTPIQLAAERLQRRYGGTVEAGDTTFARLTDTIVRQVGDLRRMVDEFSSFARMPKPVFRAEALVDTARQVLFLHEVAHPAIRFALIHHEPGPTLLCDRRQIAQALTNLVKNAVEAVEAKGGEGHDVTMTLAHAPGSVIVEVADSGVGLPAERERIVEPYMTTRARGTGLGLAIVKKIVEEHHGTMTFADRPGGGSVVTMAFDTVALAVEDAGDDRGEAPTDVNGGINGERPLATATSSRN